MRQSAMAMLVMALLAGGVPAAHEGHAHKVMGTVTVLHQNHLEVRGTDGKLATITLSPKTVVVRGTTIVEPGEIATGDRVVVTATETKGPDGKKAMVASRIQLGTARPAK